MRAFEDDEALLRFKLRLDPEALAAVDRVLEGALRASRLAESLTTQRRQREQAQLERLEEAELRAARAMSLAADALHNVRGGPKELVVESLRADVEGVLRNPPKGREGLTNPRGRGGGSGRRTGGGGPGQKGKPGKGRTG